MVPDQKAGSSRKKKKKTSNEVGRWGLDRLRQELAGLCPRTNRYAANQRRALVAYSYTIRDRAPTPICHKCYTFGKYCYGRLLLLITGGADRKKPVPCGWLDDIWCRPRYCNGEVEENPTSVRTGETPDFCSFFFVLFPICLWWRPGRGILVLGLVYILVPARISILVHISLCPFTVLLFGPDFRPMAIIPFAPWLRHGCSGDGTRFISTVVRLGRMS